MENTHFIPKYLNELASLLGALDAMSTRIAQAAAMCIASLSADGKVIFCGNGGSAGDAQHLAAELMGRFLVDRAPMAALALTVDTSALTAIGNDYGYDDVFARQLRGIGQNGDVLVGLSTSGNSANVVRAFEVARQMGIHTIGFTGLGGGALARVSDILLDVPHTQTSHVQEAHIAIGHILCAIVEKSMCSTKL
jgi:D-sedoheptulose 7-phosphate isomerase